jgi:RHS repeat-associated protein
VKQGQHRPGEVSKTRPVRVIGEVDEGSVASEVQPETAAFDDLARHCYDPPVVRIRLGRSRPHRRDAHRGQRPVFGHTRGGRYSWARYYHPSLQRFISEDPIEFAGGDVNLYAYVLNRPTVFRDPSGEIIPLPIATGLIGLAAGGLGSAVGQIIANGGFDNFSYQHVAIAAGVGFAAGAAAPFVATSYGGAIALGAVANLAQYGIGGALGDQVTLGGALWSAALGGAGGAIGGPVLRATGLRFDETSPFLTKELARYLNRRADILANVGLGNLMRNLLGSTLSNVEAAEAAQNMSGRK